MNYDEQILTLLNKNAVLANLVRELLEYLEEDMSTDQNYIVYIYEQLEDLESDGELEEE